MKIRNSIPIGLISSRVENRFLILTKEIALILTFAILTGISAQLKIEIGPVPITLQTLAVLLSGILLGSIRGAFSQIVYLFGGLIGLPWFSRGGGMIYIMSPSFGYILGFVLAAFIVGWLWERGFGRNFKTGILAMFLANILIYFPGLLWLAKLICSPTNPFCLGGGFEKVLAVGLYPFIIGDLLKILLASLLVPLIRKVRYTLG